MNRDPIALAASDWVARSQQGLLSARQQARFQRWCDASPLHRQAVAEAERAWELVGALRGDPEFTSAARKPLPSSWWSRQQVAGMWPAAGLALAACWGLWIGTDLPLRWQADYYSAVGEVRAIELPDGSRVQLGSGAALAMQYGDAERRVRLLRGEAIFTPAPVDAQEPRAFVVDAAGATAIALGTEYMVRVLDGQHGWLGVLQHSVELRLHEPDQADSRVVKEGESAWFDEQGITPAELDLADATSWRNGLLVFRREPLPQVIERLNQYHPGRIMVVGEALQQRRVSAVFPIRDLDHALETLERELGAKSTSLAGLSLLY